MKFPDNPGIFSRTAGSQAEIRDAVCFMLSPLNALRTLYPFKKNKINIIRNKYAELHEVLCIYTNRGRPLRTPRSPGGTIKCCRTNKTNIIGNLQTKTATSYLISAENAYEKVIGIDNLSAGKYIAIARVQHNIGTSSTGRLSWLSLVSGSEVPGTSYGNATTLPGGTPYPIGNIVRVIELSKLDSINVYVRSNNIDSVFAGILQVCRIS